MKLYEKLKQYNTDEELNALSRLIGVFIAASIIMVLLLW